MIFDWIHGIELDWIRTIHLFRSDALDLFFILMNFFDRMEFYFTLITIVWYFLSPQWGLRLFFLMICNSLVNGMVKSIFQEPRPFHLDPSLMVLHATSYGFPSGAAQSAVLLPFILIKEWRSKWSWALGLSFFILISFSRIYLGVHFFSDLVIGWVIGLSLAYTFCQYYKTWEKKIDESPINAYGFFVFILLSLNWLIPQSIMQKPAWIAIGALCGLYYIHDKLYEWPVAKSFLGNCLLALITLFTILFISLTEKISPSSLMIFFNFLIGFSALGLLPYYFQSHLLKRAKPMKIYRFKK